MSSAALLASPRRETLLRFNLQPSRCVHPDRWAEFLPANWAPPAQDDAVAHRHVSRLILRKLDLVHRLADQVDRPEWPIALAAPDLIAGACRALGLVSIQQQVRRVVRRDHVLALSQALDEHDLQFVRTRAPQLGDADPVFDGQPLDALLARLDDIGAAVLARSLGEAPDALGRRALLRLPSTRSQCSRDAGSARELSLRILEERDPPWISSFDTAH